MHAMVAKVPLNYLCFRFVVSTRGNRFKSRNVLLRVAQVAGSSFVSQSVNGMVQKVLGLKVSLDTEERLVVHI